MPCAASLGLAERAMNFKMIFYERQREREEDHHSLHNTSLSIPFLFAQHKKIEWKIFTLILSSRCAGGEKT